MIASGDFGGKVRVWENKSPHFCQIKLIDSGAFHIWVYFTKDSSKLITGDYDNELKMWDVYNDFNEITSRSDPNWGNIKKVKTS